MAKAEKEKIGQEEEPEARRKADCVDALCAMTRDTDKGIKRICDTIRQENPDFPKASTIQDWIESDEALAGQYARAKDFQIERIAEQILEISDDGTSDVVIREDGTTFVNMEHIQRSRLRVDSRKWILSKLKPKKYGDKIEQTLQNPDGSALTIQVVKFGDSSAS